MQTERSCRGVKLLLATKPERLCRAVILMTMVAFVTTVFVRLGDLPFHSPEWYAVQVSERPFPRQVVPSVMLGREKKGSLASRC